MVSVIGRLMDKFLMDKLEESKTHFIELLKELTLTPSWVSWYLQWWGQETARSFALLRMVGIFKELAKAHQKFLGPKI